MKGVPATAWVTALGVGQERVEREVMGRTTTRLSLSRPLPLQVEHKSLKREILPTSTACPPVPRHVVLPQA